MKEKRIIIIGGSEREHAHIEYSNPIEMLKDFRTYNRLCGDRGALNLSALTGLFGGKTATKQMTGYPSTLTVEQGDANFNTALAVYTLAQVAAGVTARIYEHSVPPRTQKVWGSGAYGIQSNQGYMWFILALLKTAFQVDKITLAVESYDRHVFQPVFESTDDVLHLSDPTDLTTATPTNILEMKALPETMVIAAAYSRLVINCQCLVPQAGMDTAVFTIPITVASQ